MFDQEILRTFVTILKTGSFTAAAEQVGRTPSAVSMQIKRLEEATGRRLMVRSAHGVTATAEGELLLMHAQQILKAHDEAFDAMMGARTEASLRIGLPDMYLLPLVRPHLAELERRFPETGLHITCGGSPEMLQAFNEGSLDIALLTEYQLGDERGELIHRERNAWACKLGSKIFEQTPLPLALAFEGSLYRRIAQEVLRQQGRPYRIAVATNRQQAVQVAIDAGAAVGLLPESWLLPSMLVLTAEDGFPDVPPLSVRMRVNGRRLSPAGIWLADRLRSGISRT